MWVESAKFIEGENLGPVCFSMWKPHCLNKKKHEVMSACIYTYFCKDKNT